MDSMEKLHDWMDIALEFSWVPWSLSLVYLGGIHFGQQLMLNHTEFDLKPILFLWNLSLTVFSFVGFFKTFPAVVSIFPETCRVRLDEQAATWLTLFMLSKVPELFDTLFLVLRKKEVKFLHYFHHSSVLVYSWTAYASRSPIGIYFTTMNLGVHSIM